MDKQTWKLAVALNNIATVNKSTLINSISDVREQSGLNKSDFDKAICKLEKAGMIITTPGNNKVVEIQLTKDFHL